MLYDKKAMGGGKMRGGGYMIKRVYGGGLLML